MNTRRAEGEVGTGLQILLCLDFYSGKTAHKSTIIRSSLGPQKEEDNGETILGIICCLRADEKWEMCVKRKRTLVAGQTKKV